MLKGWLAKKYEKFYLKKLLQNYEKPEVLLQRSTFTEEKSRPVDFVYVTFIKIHVHCTVSLIIENIALLVYGFFPQLQDIADFLYLSLISQ